MKTKKKKLSPKFERWYWKVNPVSGYSPLRQYKILIFALLLSACGGELARIPENPFVAPTLIPKTAVPPIEILNTIEPIATISCEDNLEFIEDVTVQDGTRFAPNASIEKIWLVRNSGTCNWESGYTLQLISGPDLGAETTQALFPARSGSEIEINVGFTAPDAPGNYISKWRAFNPAGEPFGDLIFIDISVDVSLVPITTTADAEEESDGE